MFFEGFEDVGVDGVLDPAFKFAVKHIFGQGRRGGFYFMKCPVGFCFFPVGLRLDDAGGFAGAWIGRAAADPAFEFGNLRVGEGVFVGRGHRVGEVFNALDEDAFPRIPRHDGRTSIASGA